jgi:DtxR family Mn-dependent transcriptional regulator
MTAKDIQLRVPDSYRPRGSREKNRTEISESFGEYLEGIWRLLQENASVSTGELSQYMGVQPASVTTMLKRLAEQGYVEHIPYQGVRLTPSGNAEACSLLRKHRLVECLLVGYLELPWDNVHDMACRLEHFLSAEVADRMELALGFPAACPHGNPIKPDTEDNYTRLSEAKTGDHLIVKRITDERKEFLTYLKGIGLVPETSVEVAERNPFGDILMLNIQGTHWPVAIGCGAAKAIRVRHIEQ